MEGVVKEAAVKYGHVYVMKKEERIQNVGGVLMMEVAGMRGRGRLFSPRSHNPR